MTSASTINIHNPEAALLLGLSQLSSQLTQILDSISDNDYIAAKDGKSSIGGHTRHIIEFMQAVSKSSDIVNFDDRERSLDIETSKNYAQNALKSVTSDIADTLKKDGVAKPISMVEQLSNENIAIPIPSTIGREIAYAIQHGIHHVFIIKTHAELLGISLDDHIGVAPATVTYQNQ